MSYFRNKKISLVIVALCIGGLFLIGIVFVSQVVVHSMAQQTYSDIAAIPAKKTGLLLGTNKYVPDGRENLFYIYRIRAAVDLYTQNKIEFILISGDNSTQSYNEPEDMQADLIDAGIPAEKIYLDYAGLRTWDSIIRAHKVFLENDFIIISQQFQNERALYAAKANGIEAIAYNAQDVPISRSPRIWLRERFARVKVVLDATVNVDPKYLGETIEIR